MKKGRERGRAAVNSDDRRTNLSANEKGQGNEDPETEFGVLSHP